MLITRAFQQSRYCTHVYRITFGRRSAESFHTGGRLLLLLVFVFLLFPQLRSQAVHHLNVWGGGGYSRLDHGIGDNSVGYSTHVPGGFGYEGGFGYQLDIGRFMLNMGAEFQHIHSRTKLHDYRTEYDFQYIGTSIPDGSVHYVTYGYDFLTYEEKHSLGYLNFPLLGGVRFDRYYALLGVKVGVNLFSRYKVANTTLRVSASDPQFIVPMEEIGHGTGDQAVVISGDMNFGLNVSPTLEFGVYLNEWLPRSLTQLSNRVRTPLTYRVGIFVDYGVFNLNKSSTDRPMVNAPLDNDPGNISLNPLSESYLSSGKVFSTLVAGIKVTVQFQLSKKRKPKTIPPTPAFYARVIDEDTGDPLDAEVTLNMPSGRKQEIFRHRTDGYGVVGQSELKAGRYMLSSTSDGYNTYRKSIRHTRGDTLLVAMKLTPVFHVHVYDVETHRNLRSEITLTVPNAGPTVKPVLKGQTDEKTGMLSGNIRTGRYQLHATSEGYIYHQELVSYVKTDTIRIALQPIKKDVVVVLHDLYFAWDEATILPESEAALEELYQFLVNNPSVSIRITGHTDNTGSLSYNMRLSGARAKAVYDTLIERGIDSGRLSYEGRGPTQPVSTNDTEEGRAQNRRVEFVIQ